MENFESRRIPETEIEENIFTQAIEQYAVGEIETDFDEQAVARLQESLDQTKLFLLGEMHGVAENPNIIYTLFKKFGFKRLALEWDGQELQDLVDKFLATGHLDPEAIKDKDSGDGRITAGHFALLRRLKEEGLLEDIILFDANEESWDDRDKSMADTILADEIDEKTLVIAGNLHAKVEPFTFSNETELHHPMGENIKNQIPELSSGKIEYRLGQYYNHGIKEFWNNPDKETIERAKFYQSEDGLYHYDIPEAHLAMVPNPKEINIEESEIEKPAILYHASPIKNIDQLKPANETTRDENEGEVVFAGANLAEVSRFLVPVDDSWTLIATYKNIPTIVISDEHRFRELDKGGAIYRLSSDTFSITNPDHPDEWTSSEPVNTLDEKIVESALDTMIDYGVQVYFVDNTTFERIKKEGKEGYITLNNLESENKKLGKNSVIIPEEI
jgi:hypothetical protein